MRAFWSVRAALLAALAPSAVECIDNGLGRTPPLGWRAWLPFNKHINQSLMTASIDAMVRKRNGISLLDVGYAHVGLDDYWQACGTGADGSFHTAVGCKAPMGIGRALSPWVALSLSCVVCVCSGGSVFCTVIVGIV